MYTEMVGHTAVRKSAKVEELLQYVSSKLNQVEDPYDYINYHYFMNRVYDFELVQKL